MFKVYMTNFGYDKGVYATIPEAMTAGLKTGFCFTIINVTTGEVMGFYDTITGWHYSECVEQQGN